MPELNSKPVSQELLNELYSIRLLIFLEDLPQSNKYHQVYLNKDEFKQISFLIGSIVNKRKDIQDVKMRWSDKTYSLPDLRELNQ